MDITLIDERFAPKLLFGNAVLLRWHGRGPEGGWATFARRAVKSGNAMFTLDSRRIISHLASS